MAAGFSFGKSSVDNPLRYQEQKRVYDAQKEQSDLQDPIYTETRAIQEGNTTVNKLCIPIKKIVLLNNHLLSQSTLDELFVKRLNKCNTLGDINNLVRQINNIYIKKGYITSRAYIKPQKLSTGNLAINAMEGRIEKIVEKNVNTHFITGNIDGGYFDLREIETYIEQLNRLQSKKVVMYWSYLF